MKHHCTTTMKTTIILAIIGVSLLPLLVEGSRGKHEKPPMATKGSSSSSKRATSEDYRVDLDQLQEIVPAFEKYDGDFYAGTFSTDPPPDDDDDVGGQQDEEDGGGSLMFFMFAPHEPIVDDSLIIWFNGGPGCSSVAGMFFENSPITIPLHPAGFAGPSKADDPLVYNPYGWTNATAIMYMEQPHGVGFSQGPEPESEDDVARYFLNFLRNFYEAFPDWRDKKLHLFGESYAGYFVPSIAHKIHQFNKLIEKNNKEKEGKHGAKSINLQGIALGNGWVDAEVQGHMLVDYAFWHGLIDTNTKRAFEQQWDRCMANKKMEAPFHSFTTPDDCGMVGAVVEAAGGGLMEKVYGYGQFDFPGVNIYDVTTWDGYSVLFDEDSTYSNFFNNPKVQELLHAPDMHWEQCVPGAGRRRKRGRQLLEGDQSRKFSVQHQQHHRSLGLLEHDQPESVMPYIAEMLDEANIQVLIYNGDRDMSTCSQGNEVLLDSMDWKGAGDWHDPYITRRGLWVVDEMPAGYAKGSNNLTFVVVYNSGHLVPYNVPKQALDLVTRYLQGSSFVDQKLPVFAPDKKSDELDHSSSNEWLSPGMKRKGGIHLHIVTLVLGILLGAFGTFVFSNKKRLKRALGIGNYQQYEQV